MLSLSLEHAKGLFANFSDYPRLLQAPVPQSPLLSRIPSIGFSEDGGLLEEGEEEKILYMDITLPAQQRNQPTHHFFSNTFEFLTCY